MRQFALPNVHLHRTYRDFRKLRKCLCDKRIALPTRRLNGMTMYPLKAATRTNIDLSTK